MVTSTYMTLTDERWLSPLPLWTGILAGPIAWAIDLRLIVMVVAICIAVTLVAGFSGTWRAMGAKAAPLLRNE